MMSSFCKRTTSLTSIMLAMVISIISSSVNTAVKQITDNKQGPIVPSLPTKSSQVSCFSLIQPLFSNHQARVHLATCKKFNQNNKPRSCFSFPSALLLSELNPPLLTAGWILPWSSSNHLTWTANPTTSSGQPKYNQNTT